MTQLLWRETEEGIKPFLESGDPVVWGPLPGSQQAFLTCPVNEVLYEGERGPGKTDSLLMSFGQHVGVGFGEEWRGILFRQTFPQLQDVIAKSRKWFKRIWPDCNFNIQTSTWTWPSGESLRFRVFSRSSDYDNYHGHAYPWIGWEELTNWPDARCYISMFSCNRSTKVGIPLMVRSTTNPYGFGHNWVKGRWQLPINGRRIIGPIIRTKDEPDRVAIHGCLSENKILLHAQPDYPNKIRAAAKNKSQLRAWLYGDWNVTSGGMFDDIWDNNTHVVSPFKVPRGWSIDRSFDWGSAAPFSVGWWAESDGSDYQDGSGQWRSSVRGDLFRIAEWYGWNENEEQPEGLRMLASEIAQGIIERQIEMGLHDRVQPGPADTSIWTEENGPSIAKDMLRPVRINGQRVAGVRWTKADKRPGSRVSGWEAIRQRLKDSASKGGPREKPGLFVFENCRQFIRTFPPLPRDEKKIDDVYTDAEDHIADEVRYRVRACGRQAKVGRVIGLQ